MKKLAFLLIGLLMIGTLKADIESVFDESASGTTSATVIIPQGGSPANVTDLAWKLDNGVTTGVIRVLPARTAFTVTSATSGTGTVAWFANTGTAVAADDFIIFWDESDVNGDAYALHEVTAATTTSVTVGSTIAVAMTTSDKIWHVPLAYVTEIPLPAYSTVSATQFTKNLWLPAGVPAALTVDGNTTSCRISISGVRSHYR